MSTVLGTSASAASTIDATPAGTPLGWSMWPVNASLAAATRPRSAVPATPERSRQRGTPIPAAPSQYDPWCPVPVDVGHGGGADVQCLKLRLVGLVTTHPPPAVRALHVPDVMPDRTDQHGQHPVTGWLVLDRNLQGQCQPAGCCLGLAAGALVGTATVPIVTPRCVMGRADGQAMPMSITGWLPGRSQRSIASSLSAGMLTQPAVARSRLTCRKNAEPAPGTTAERL